MDLGRLSAEYRAVYGTKIVFCPEVTRSVEVKCLAEKVLRLGIVLVEAKVLCYADVEKALTQYLAFNKKLLKSWGAKGSVFYMTALAKM